jgi:hypothetical protein
MKSKATVIPATTTKRWEQLGKIGRNDYFQLWCVHTTLARFYVMTVGPDRKRWVWQYMLHKLKWVKVISKRKYSTRLAAQRACVRFFKRYRGLPS